MKKSILFLILALPCSLGFSQTVKCYMAGDSGQSQVIIASPKPLNVSDSDYLEVATAELESRYLNHPKTLQKLGTINQFECVYLDQLFNTEEANTQFSELVH
ncbi:hypothetical protein M0C34_16165 [Agarivorans sp. TSD2052]|uniref:hypothetical protein n=1 Tax=Agarivorans sp. TSD2052 TaxID=2937286 RepID=UPI00200FB31B|nr:hypothetical protein [Agarivorans sp. TSD2052]UPW17755.1 hypothetical protein M0C34_16165 [Agarivorans sp. TSD2052]